MAPEPTSHGEPNAGKQQLKVVTGQVVFKCEYRRVAA